MATVTVWEPRAGLGPAGPHREWTAEPVSTGVSGPGGGGGPTWRAADSRWAYGGWRCYGPGAPATGWRGRAGGQRVSDVRLRVDLGLGMGQKGLGEQRVSQRVREGKYGSEETPRTGVL